MKSYLKEFGETFYTQVKRLIDEAMFKEENEKPILEAYQSILKLKILPKKDNYQFVEFKELIIELITHANEYNEINSKFFGRDLLMTKVII